VQRKVVEVTPSIVSPPVRISDLFSRVRSIIAGNRLYRKFLIASSLLVISFASAAFFTVAAMKQFDLSESAIGVFTIMTIAGQILSGVFLGWIADTKGTKNALVICGVCMLISIAAALLAHSIVWFYFVFVFFGINVGAETFMRYNYAVECAPEGDRPMYIGLMNAWFAPFYLVAPCAGWLSELYGYHFVFLLSLVVGVIGIILLARTPDPRMTKLALSSK
jgi:MFS family permease